MTVATEMLGIHLRAGRVGYCTIDDAEMYGIVYRDWNDGGMPSLVGRHRLGDFGPNIIASLRAGTAVMIADVSRDPLTDDPSVTAAFAGLDVRSLVNVPLVKDRQLLAILFVHERDPRLWTACELRLVQEVCARTFAAAEQARAEAVLADVRDELETTVATRTEELARSNALLVGEISRREEAQAALLQAQKLEALGQLTGGVAHDFNNMLAAIQGSFTLLRKRVHDETGQRLLQSGIQASERAAALIRQLLAFARREEVRPAVLEPRSVLSDVGELLCQAVGRKIELIVEPVSPDTWRVAADLHQLEVALMNLAVNARDAMPDGGTVVIATRNAKAGDDAVLSDLPAQDYVLFQVRDTGMGMSLEVSAKAMEPFFTTKPVGKGTGLGLAMVHGMAQQLGGKLHIDSTLEAGTTMTIALPRCEQLVTDTAVNETAINQDLHGGATVLVVDDNDQVRIVTASFLRDLRYTVIEAASAEAAYALAHASGSVDLVITDVVMPNADGLKLAGRLRADWPKLPILFVTGYPGDADLADETVLSKPLSFSDMATQVARRLGRITPHHNRLTC